MSSPFNRGQQAFKTPLTDLWVAHGYLHLNDYPLQLQLTSFYNEV